MNLASLKAGDTSWAIAPVASKTGASSATGRAALLEKRRSTDGTQTGNTKADKSPVEISPSIPVAVSTDPRQQSIANLAFAGSEPNTPVPASQTTSDEAGNAATVAKLIAGMDITNPRTTLPQPHGFSFVPEPNAKATGSANPADGSQSAHPISQQDSLSDSASKTMPTGATSGTGASSAQGKKKSVGTIATASGSKAAQASEAEPAIANGEVSASAKDATGTVSTDQAAIADSQNPGFQSAVTGTDEANRTYSELLANLKLGKSSSTQAAAKAGSSDKKLSDKLGREADLADTAPGSARGSDQTKQVLAAEKIVNSVAQNAPAQGGAVVETNIPPAPHESFKDHAANTENPVTDHISDEPAASQPIPTAPLGTVQTASLVQHLSETEMHVGIQTGEFGKIDIHTSINQNQISARIYVEHDELGKAMAANLPQLHEKLSVEHRLDAQIELHNTGTNHSNGSDRQQSQQQRTTQNGPASRDADDPIPQVETAREPASTLSNMGLDMHV
jgi:hypothetical protein